MMKINFLWIASVAIILLLFHSCRTEATTESDSDLENGASYKTVKLKDVAEFKNLIISNPYLLGHQYGIVAEDTMYLLNIDTKEMNSYSLQISPKNDSAFYIVILSYDKQKNNKVSKLVGKFVSDKNDGNKNLKTFTGKSYFTTIAGTEVVSSVWKNGKVIHNEPSMSNKGCNVTYSVVGSMCSEGLHYPWDSGACQASGKPFWTISSSTQCDQEVIDPNWGGGGFGDIGGGGGIKFQPFLLPANELAIFNNLPLEVQYGIKNYYHGSNEYTNEEYQFVLWTINFFGENPNTTWTQFENWFIKGSLDYTNSSDVEFAGNLSGMSYDLNLANQNGTLGLLETNWPNWTKVKQDIKNSIAIGVHETAKKVKTYYDTFRHSDYYNSATRVVLNIYIDALRNEIKQTTDMNPDTMQWKDLFNIWLFELSRPTFPNDRINFTWNSNIVNGNNIHNPNTNAVWTFPKGEPSILPSIKNGLKNGTFNIESPAIIGTFKYDFAKYYATLSQGNVGIQMLGSYDIKATVISKSGNTAVIRFFITNPLNWDSGTRFVQTPSSTIGIIPNKEIGEGLHLGGNLTNTYTWDEIVTF